MEKIFAGLKKGLVAPCYLLYGEEEYLINKNLNSILDIIVPAADRDFSLFFQDGESTDVDSLMKSVQTPSLLGSRKVVVVKNTTLFSSRQNTADIIQKIIDNIEDNPSKAAKYFLAFLKIAGFSLEDLQDGGWQKITDDQWREAMMGEGAWEEREKWLPRVLDICAGPGFKAASDNDKTDELEQLVQKAFTAGNCIIFTAETIDKRKKNYKIIAGMGEVIYFGKTRRESTQKDALIKEAQKLLHNSGKKMSPAAWTALGNKTGWELRPSIMELEKLVFFAGNRQVIEEKDVDEVVGKTKQDSIFDLTTSLGEKNSPAALAALKALLDQGVHHLMILTMLTREVRFLLQARILSDEKKLPPFKAHMEFGWFQKNVYPALTELKEAKSSAGDLIFSQHPFVVYNAWRNCGRFSYHILVSFLDDLLEIDRAFKSSASDPQLLLENFLIKACAKVS